METETKSRKSIRYFVGTIPNNPEQQAYPQQVKLRQKSMWENGSYPYLVDWQLEEDSMESGDR